MGDGMLRDILDIERQIEAELEEVRVKTRTWLEEQKLEIDRQAETALQEAEQNACQAGQSMCQDARRRGAERLRAMRRQVRRLTMLSDESLQQALRGYVEQLTSGGHDDHQDGEN